MNSFLGFVNTVMGGREEIKQEVILPWEGFKGQIQNAAKLAVMEVSKKQESFFEFQEGMDTDLYEFDLDEKAPVIMKLLEIDQELQRKQRSIVPVKNSEYFFWKSYFYNVEKAVDSVGAEQNYQGEIDDFHKELMDELETQLNNQPVKASKQASLKKQLEEALKRISDLETRVKILEEKSYDN